MILNKNRMHVQSLDEEMHEQITKMKANRMKNANQICDEIYMRQYKRLKESYAKHKQEKQEKNKEKTHQEMALEDIESRVEEDFHRN